MGVFTVMYQTQFAPKLNIAISDALNNEVKECALNIIENSATDRIYNAYAPKFLSRRYSFSSDGGYETSVSGNTLTITATSALQNLYGGNHSEDLGDIVAEGWENFNMPFARPWMDEGVSNNLQQIETALMNGMKRQGF